MHYKEMLFIAKHPDFHPVILSYADNTHYLIGNATDKHYYDIATDKKGKPVHFNCLTEAKDALKTFGCKHTQLVIQTPYDEMVGQVENINASECIMEIDLE